MKKSLLIAAIMCAISFSAQATVFGNTTNNNQTYNNPTANGGAGGNASSDSTAVGVGVGVGVGVANVDNDIRNTVNTNISNDVRNNAAATVLSSGNSSSDSSAKSNSDSQSNSSVGDIDASTKINYKRPPVASALAYAPAPSAPCYYGGAIGAQGVGFGFSASKSTRDDECNARENIRTAFNYGDVEVAEEMLNEIEGYAAAKERIAKRKQAEVAGK